MANEDAHNLARQRLLGLLDFYGLQDERIIVIPGDVILTDLDVVPRLLATSAAAFPDEKPAFVFDTWDKSLGADPDKTCEVLPAVERVDELIKDGAPFVLTLSHSPWSSPERTKGSVSYWASQQARIKIERDEVTGHGKLDLVHMKNGPSGLHLEFEYQQHAFTIDDETSTCLVPQRIYDAPDRTPPKAQARAPHGSLQKIMLAELAKLARRHPNGVDEPELKSAFVLALDTYRRSKGETSLQPKHATDKFNKTLDRLIEAGEIDRLADGQLLPGNGSGTGMVVVAIPGAPLKGVTTTRITTSPTDPVVVVHDQITTCFATFHDHNLR